MNKITFEKQSSKKRNNSEETNTIIKKKKQKHSIDVTIHWKKIHSLYKTNTTKLFECNSKTNYLIILDPLGDRSHFIISKTSYYWFNESIRLMQQHIDYGTTYHTAIIGEIIEIERNLKALKLNVEKNGNKKTFFYRAEALLNFIRLCCTIYDNQLEKYVQRLNALFILCTICWLHMFDLILPISIIQVEKNFLFDDDYEDFENDSILRYYRKDDQQKIKKINIEYPNIRHILYSIILIIEKFHIDQICLQRFQMIYEIWILIDNELNLHQMKISEKKFRKNSIEKCSWNFLDQCNKYETIFGTFINNAT